MSQRIRVITSIAAWLITPLILSGCLTTEGEVGTGSDSPPDPIDPIDPPTDPTNRAPLITGDPPDSIRVGVNYSFTPGAVDPDNDPMTFSIENKPSWANFDAASGSLFGVPLLGSDGMYEGIVVAVSDGSLKTSMDAFAIMVQPDTAENQPPEISGIPSASVLVGEAYSFTPDASDPDGDPLIFSVTRNPDWLSIDTATGELSGTPTTDDLGAHARIRITVSDGEFQSNLPRFTVTVITENSPPEISGNPPTSAVVGQEYSFTPDAMDADGDNLLFEISGLPSWANFAPTTGELSGTPEDGDEGRHSNIRISVTDGNASDSLSAFSITVESAGTGNGTANLTWDAPTKNTDDSDLTDLVGYVVSYGLSENQMNTQVAVDGATNTSYVVENLSQGTWYFGVAAKNSAGVLSDLSNIVNKTID